MGTSPAPPPPRPHKVDESPQETLWDHPVKEHRYLGHRSMIGCRAKYLASLCDRLVGALSLRFAAHKLGPRARFVGCDEATRLRSLPRLLNNNRFPILPWVRIPSLALRILALSVRRAREDWRAQHGVWPCLARTFVGPSRFRGTRYAAANWTQPGAARGFPRPGKDFVFHGDAKDPYVMVTGPASQGLSGPTRAGCRTQGRNLLT